jgi:hypothetical protein
MVQLVLSQVISIYGAEYIPLYLDVVACMCGQQMDASFDITAYILPTATAYSYLHRHSSWTAPDVDRR